MSLKAAFVEWPHGLTPVGTEWDQIRRLVDEADADLLITNEMPFGDWVANSPTFDQCVADRSIAVHESALDALAELSVPNIVSSRPIGRPGGLVNEAFALTGGVYRPIHQKHYFPEEPGYFEASWFGTTVTGFEPIEVAGATLGVLLCTELFFTEKAREYGNRGVDLIAVPRAAGPINRQWKTAGAMAAISSGAYLLSSNRAGTSRTGQSFGGFGFAFDPTGNAMANTTPSSPICVVEIDLQVASRQKLEYPCYVPEFPAPA